MNYVRVDEGRAIISVDCYFFYVNFPHNIFIYLDRHWSVSSVYKLAACSTPVYIEAHPTYLNAFD